MDLQAQEDVLPMSRFFIAGYHFRKMHIVQTQILSEMNTIEKIKHRKGLLNYAIQFCFLCTQFIFSQQLHAQIQQMPNVIIIIADDLGYGDLGCYGGKTRTPNIDRLASEGVLFTDFHTSGTTCSPTRAGLMTGLYQFRVGVPGVIVAFPDDKAHKRGLDINAVTFPKLLKKEGYATGLFGKWHLGYSEEYNPTNFGFDEFKGFLSGQIDYHSHIDLAGATDWWQQKKKNDEIGYSTHLINKHSVDFVKKNKDNPFCLVVSHEAVHGPFQGPDDPSFRIEGVSYPTVPKEKQIRPVKETLSIMMEEMDKGVGQLMESLEELGISNNTIVIFMSDNGGVLNISSNAPFRGGKGQVWEGGHRITAIISWPGTIEAGIVSDIPSISLDIMPTILNLVGIDVQPQVQFDGISLYPVLVEQKPLDKSRLFFWDTSNFSKNGYAVRMANWKLVGSESEKPLLFNLSNDKGENNDLSSKFPRLVKKMQKEYNIWKNDVGVDMYKDK